MRTVVALAAAMFYASQQQRRALLMASDLIAPYQLNRDTTTREAAGVLVAAFARLVSWTDSSDAMLRRQLDAPEAVGAGTAAEQLARAQSMRREGAELLILGVAAIANALIDTADVTGRSATIRVGRLRLTAGERERLLSDLQQSFGSALRPRGGQWSSDYAAAASVLDRFLRQGWRLIP